MGQVRAGFPEEAMPAAGRNGGPRSIAGPQTKPSQVQRSSEVSPAARARGLQGQKGRGLAAPGAGWGEPDARGGCRGGAPGSQNLRVVLRAFVIPRVPCVCVHTRVPRDSNPSASRGRQRRVVGRIGRGAGKMIRTACAKALRPEELRTVRAGNRRRVRQGLTREVGRVPGGG